MTRGRLAPTPSGYLHLGNARSFLLAWLWAKASGGDVVLRIEDIDKPRCKPEFTQAALDDLAWLGLTNAQVEDAGASARPAIQSERLELYRRHLHVLMEKRLAYPCTCTRRDIEEASSAPHGDEGPIYPGTCRGRWRDAEHAREATGREPAWRFLWQSAPVAFHDELHGDITIDPSILGDFVLWRRDYLPSYQLAVTVDDALQGITQVLRGRDLLQSTARQLALYEALQLEPPTQWAHVPFIREASRRMAKREGATSLRSLRETGADARRVVGFLAWSAGLIAECRPCTPAELIAGFDVRKIAPADFEMTPADFSICLSTTA